MVCLGFDYMGLCSYSGFMVLLGFDDMSLSPYFGFVVCLGFNYMGLSSHCGFMVCLGFDNVGFSPYFRFVVCLGFNHMVGLCYNYLGFMVLLPYDLVMQFEWNRGFFQTIIVFLKVLGLSFFTTGTLQPRFSPSFWG